MIALLTSRLAGPIATGAAVLLALALAVTQFRFMDMRGQRDEVQAELLQNMQQLAQCRSNVAGLEYGVFVQNARVDLLRVQGEAMREAGRHALAEAETRVSEARTRAERIRSAVPVGTDCEAAGTLASQILFGES